MAEQSDGDTREPTKAVGMPRGKRGRNAYRQAMIAFVVDERRREPTVRYGEMERRVRARFGVSVPTAQRALADAADVLRGDFERFCQDAPRIIFDAYMGLHAEHIARAMSSSRERDRVLHLAHARHSLDSVRDMFGMRASINININGDGDVPDESYAPLSDVQLEALARLDELGVTGGRVLDVPSVETSVGLATVVLDEISTEGEE